MCNLLIPCSLVERVFACCNFWGPTKTWQVKPDLDPRDRITHYERGGDARNDSLRGGRWSRPNPFLGGDRAFRRVAGRARLRLLRPERYGILKPDVALLPRSRPRFAVREEFAAALDHRLASDPYRRERRQGADHRGRRAGTAARRRRQRASVQDEGVCGRYPEQGELHGFVDGCGTAQ